MKESKITAKEIFMKLNKMREELRELDRALEAVGDECGPDSAPYNVLHKLFNEKADEANKYENKVFVEVFD